MKEFEKFIEEGKVRETNPNPSQARSLIQKAGKRLNYVEERETTEENADLILEDSYEAVREALDAFLILDGYKSHSHEASIIYGFENLEIPYSTTNKLNKFRKLRNDSKYRGEDIKKKEAENTLTTAKELIPLLKDKFKETKDQR